MSEKTETQQEDPTYTDEQIDQRIEHLEVAGSALRTIWSEVEAANSAIQRAQKHLSDLQSEVGYGKDKFGQELDAIRHELGQNQLGFTEQRVSTAGRDFRQSADILRKAHRDTLKNMSVPGETPEQYFQWIAEFYGKLGSPKEDKR